MKHDIKRIEKIIFRKMRHRDSLILLKLNKFIKEKNDIEGSWAEDIVNSNEVKALVGKWIICEAKNVNTRDTKKNKVKLRIDSIEPVLGGQAWFIVNMGMYRFLIFKINKIIEYDLEKPNYEDLFLPEENE